jgi:diaminopimelate decarboxylase
LVKTEFRRSIYAKNAYMASRVEYTKESGGRRIAITHAGAQTAARTALSSDEQVTFDTWREQQSLDDMLTVIS